MAAQILYGGRLGTNLVELGFVELDALAQALSRQHGTPAALSGHFDGCDREVQARVPVPIADRLKVVPLGALAHDPSRIAVAAMDPLTDDRRSTLAAFLDVPPDRLVVALAPELRILYHLEQAYGLQRGIRFLRIRRASPAALPEAPSDDQSDVEIEVIRDLEAALATSPLDTAAIEAPDREPSPPVAPAPETLDLAPVAAPSDDDDDEDGDQDGDADDHDAPGSDPAIGAPLALDYHEAPPIDDETGRGKRRFVPSLGDGGAAVLARISVRQVHSDPALIALEPRERVRPTSPTELLRAVRRAESRDQVAELVVGGLADLDELEAVAILVVRPPMALGWRGYCPAGDDAIERLAVPLDQPGCLSAIHEAGTGSCGTIDAAEASVIDERMWALLGTEQPVEVLAAPIILGGQVVCLLYGQARRPFEVARELGPALAAAAGVAFGRLLRAAQR